MIFYIIYMVFITVCEQLGKSWRRNIIMSVFFHAHIDIFIKVTRLLRQFKIKVITLVTEVDYFQSFLAWVVYLHTNDYN